jgi:hypothetical protein
MFFDPSIPPDPEYSGALSEEELEAAHQPGPDALGLVMEVADVMATFAAQRYERIDVLRREAHVQAEQRGGSRSREIIDRSVRLELAAGLRITEHAAGVLMGIADALVHRYPAVLEALYRAVITDKHAQVLVDAVDQTAPHLRDSILPEALELARTQPVGTFRRRLRQLIETRESRTLTERHAAAVAQRRVATEPGPDGMGWIGMYGPAVEVHAIYGRLTAMAKAIIAEEAQTGREPRTLDQVRADVFADLLIDGVTDAHPDRAQGIRASVVVTVPALALLDQPDAETSSTGVPVVEGVGPIPIDRAKELCGGADGWMRVLTHPETGMVLSVGRDRYRPPAALRRLVMWRADRCMAPGCGVPASRCQIDHNIAWEHGGETSLSNNVPACQGHHIVKHHGGWRIRQLPGGAVEWISPAGRRYIVQPERHVPVFHPSDSGNAPF